jgi:hypothetical protein
MRGIDFTLRRMHGASVRGRVLKLAGSTGPFRGAVMAIGMITSGSRPSDADGGFQVRGLPPGAYTLTARDAVGDKTYIAKRSIEVGADGIEGIELSLLPPMEVSGVIRIEGDTAIKPSQARVSLQAQRQGGQSAVAEDGSFAIRNLGPDVYRVNVLAPAGLFVRSVRCGTADITDSGLDLTSGSGCDLAIALSANGGQIEGQVQDGDGKLAHRGAIVMLVPEGTRRDDLFRGTSVDANAHFKLAGIAPGSYRLYAWEEVDTNAVRYDPDFVKPFETSSQRVQISEGAIQTVTLKQIPKPEEQ